MIKIEKIANQFVEGYLKEVPVGFYDLDLAVYEFIERITELNKKKILKEYETKRDSTSIKAQLCEKLHESEDLSMTDTDKVTEKSPAMNYLGNLQDPELEYLEQISKFDPLVSAVLNLILLNDKVKVKGLLQYIEIDMNEPNFRDTWVYHSDWTFRKVLDHIARWQELIKAAPTLLVPFY